MERIIRIGTRGSDLALWQARYAQEQLAKIGLQAELQIITTKGDRIQHLGFDKIEGKGFFTREIEEALLRGDVDMAVHSMKDLPTQHPDGLVLSAVSYREDPADWLLIRRESATAGRLFQLREGAVVGTSSSRRKAQLRDFRPDVVLQDVRGNVPTRIAKLQRGDYDAILLAAAGLTRLNLDLSGLVVVKMNPKEFVPAPAQGVLAFQTHRDDLAMRRALQGIHQPAVSSCTNVERRVLQLLGGGCHMPLGVYCERDIQGNYRAWAAQADNPEGALRRAQLSSSTHYRLAERIVEALALSK